MVSQDHVHGLTGSCRICRDGLTGLYRICHDLYMVSQDRVGYAVVYIHGLTGSCRICRDLYMVSQDHVGYAVINSWSHRIM